MSDFRLSKVFDQITLLLIVKMGHTFEIRYQCGHQHTFTTPRLRGEDQFSELAADDYEVSIAKVCPHCQFLTHPDLNHRLAYIRRTLNPCRGTEYHRLDCGHYVRCAGLLSCVDNCELGYLWMPHINGCLGCRKCVVTYFQARAEREYGNLLRRVRASLEFWDLRHLSDAEFVQAAGEIFMHRYLRPLEVALVRFQTEVFESIFSCEPADTDVLYQEIDMDRMMAKLDIGATSYTTAQIQEAPKSSNAIMQEPHTCNYAAAVQKIFGATNQQALTDTEGDDENIEDDDEDPIEQFWHRNDQISQYLDKQAARVSKNHELEDVQSEKGRLVECMMDLDLR